MIPKLIFGGQYMHLHRACLKLRMAVERTVIGKCMVGRSRFLIWSLGLGPHIDPVFSLVKAAALAFCALRRKCYAKSKDPPQIAQAWARHATGLFAPYVAMWGWEHTSEAVFRTRDGSINLDCDGKATVSRHLQRAWQRSLLAGDNRCNRPDTIAAMEHGKFPTIHAHQAFAKQYGQLRTACGAAYDFRAMQGVNRTRTKHNAGAALASLECQCGNPLPTRQHWM